MRSGCFLFAIIIALLSTLLLVTPMYGAVVLAASDPSSVDSTALASTALASTAINSPDVSNVASNAIIFAAGATSGAAAGATLNAVSATLSAVSASAVPPAFAGTLDKRATLPTTSISFAPEDFTSLYAPNGGSPMTGITLTGAGGSVGRFLLDGVPYALGTAIPIADISKLKFENFASGTLSFTAYAHNATFPDPPKIGSATVIITVSPVPAPVQYLKEIYYYMSWNSYMTFDDSDFNSVFRSLTGRDLYCIRISQPSSSYGRLYYSYTSTSYDYAVSSDDRYYRSSSPRISYISFVPRDDYYGSVTLYYTAYDDNMNPYEGTVLIDIDDSDWGTGGGVNNSYLQTNTVTYSMDVGASINFSSSDFNASLVSSTGYSLSYIRFHTLPSNAAGRLTYNYRGAGGVISSTTAVSTETRYYISSSPDISSISFTPTSDYSGTINIPYTANATNGAAYGGTLFLRVGQANAAASLSDLNYKINGKASLTFSATDFQSILTKTVSSTLSYIMFTSLPSDGALYYNYRGTNDYTSAVSTGTRYYRATNPIISQITFVPKAAQTGKITIPYTAYSVNGAVYNGKIVISLGSAGNLRTLTYPMIYGEPLDFGEAGIGADIRGQVRLTAGSASSAAFSYVIFNVPPSSEGTLYKDYYEGARRRQSITEGDMYKEGASPDISDLVFTAESNANIQLTYTAFTASGAVYNGKIAIKPVTLPDSWSRDEVGSLAMRGFVPDSLLSGYDTWITRAEFTALLVNTYDYSGASASEGDRQSREAAFADIRGNPFARLIRRGYALSIIDGVSETEFDPDSPLTREAAAKILCSTIAAITFEPIGSNVDIPYTDSEAISDWAAPFVRYAYMYGLMIGDDSGAFKPQDNLSREEAMALVERAIVKYKL